MTNYLPSPSDWVADQVRRYEESGGTEGTEMRGFPVVLVTHRGRKTGAVRKTPLIRVADGDRYILVASKGGAPTHPVWTYNLREDPRVTVQDGPVRREMVVREVDEGPERERLWSIAVAAYPEYDEYQARTDRRIPVFVAEPAAA